MRSINNYIKFSVLMSIYEKESPAYFNRAMISIWEEQTVRPNEIVLIEDGPLPEVLYLAIAQWVKKLNGVLKIVSLEKNMGLGDALNIGLEYCSFELVSRMDTDDIAYKDRFKKQLDIFNKKDIDICSGWVSEFIENEENITSYRKVPEMHDEIIKYAKTRNPLNHPAVMYKKSSVLSVGGYQKMLWFEDYYLWVRMIINDAKFYNIQEPLVHMRAGDGQLERRSGYQYALRELDVQKIFLKMGFLNIFEFTINILIRVIPRVLPKMMLRQIYLFLRK